MKNYFDQLPEGFEILDRSLLETYSLCPLQGRLKELGDVRSTGVLADVGNQVHDAIGATLRSYVYSQGNLSRSELADELFLNLRQSRPDVQPEVLEAFRYSAWAWSNYIVEIHFQNILRHDGGEGNRSGQLSKDYDHLMVRVTSELDLLHATEAKQVLAEIDFKSGFKYWTAEEAKRSFQFGLHAVLVFDTYPEVECLRVSIWNSRTNRLSYPTEFERRHYQEYETRVLSAVGARQMNKGLPLDKVEAWPGREKCAWCDPRAFCNVCDRDLSADPGELLKQLVATEARADELKMILGAQVDRTGEEVRVDDLCYGTKKPKRAVKPQKTLYQLKGESDGET